MPPTTLSTRALLVAAGCLLLVVGAAAAFGLVPPSAPSVAAQDETPGEQTPQEQTPEGTATGDDPAVVSEERYVEPAPEEGDEYFEAEAEDGSWISYVNPRDRYRDPMVGNASGKICVTLRNEAGEVVVGESVPNTTVTIRTPTLGWHSHAAPMVVEFPLTDHYDRPLDADQFGTSDDLPQGDGYMDSHCIEYHGPRDDKTIEYGEAVVDGEHADDVEVVGYVQQAHEAWDSDVDAIDDSVSYEAAGGEWTMREGASHGQVTVVLQLDGVEQQADTDPETQHQTTATETATPTESVVETTANGTNETAVSDQGTDDESGPMDQDGLGFGGVFVATLLSLAGLRAGVR